MALDQCREGGPFSGKKELESKTPFLSILNNVQTLATDKKFMSQQQDIWPESLKVAKISKSERFANLKKINKGDDLNTDPQIIENEHRFDSFLVAISYFGGPKTGI